MLRITNLQRAQPLLPFVLSHLNPKLLVKGIKLESKAEGLTNQIACCLHLAVAIKALVTEDEAVLMWPISMFTRTSVCSVCVPLVF